MDETIFLKCACSHCDGHIEYPVSAVGETISCPHCGTMEILPAAVTSGRDRPATLTRFGIVGGGLLLIGLTAWMVFRQMNTSKLSMKPVVPASIDTNSIAKDKESRPDASVPKSPDDLKTSPVSFDRKPDSRLVYAVGTVKNNSAHQRFAVKIELNLFDGQGQKVGTATDYTPVIEPRDAWSYRALINEAKAVSAKIDRISEQE